MTLSGVPLAAAASRSALRSSSTSCRTATPSVNGKPASAMLCRSPGPNDGGSIRAVSMSTVAHSAAGSSGTTTSASAQAGGGGMVVVVVSEVVVGAAASSSPSPPTTPVRLSSPNITSTPTVAAMARRRRYTWADSRRWAGRCGSMALRA